MNKKFAALMFAIGLGAAAGPAFAWNCKEVCSEDYYYCVTNGGTDCIAERIECWNRLCDGQF